jgi:hypothetical protein
MLFDQKNIKQALLDTAFVLLLIALSYHFIKQLFQIHGYGSFAVSELLINYQGGFVRRGLVGEILFFFAKNFNVDVEWMVKIFTLICFVLVSAFFIKSFRKKDYNLYILPLCFFLGGMITSNSWIRKDFLMIGIFLLTLCICNKHNFSVFWKIIVINLLSIFIILTHEVYPFFAFPIVFILFWDMYKKSGTYKSVIFSFLSLLPSCFMFFLVIMIHGNQETAQAIWNSWHIIANQTPTEVEQWNAGAIGAIAWTSEWAFKMNIREIFLTINKGIFSSLVWMITFPIVYYISSNVLLVFRKTERSFTDRHKTILSSILVFQLLCLSPVFGILMLDWIRVFFFWIASSFAIFLIIPLEKIETLTPSFLTKFTNNLNNFLSSILFPRKTTLVLLMLFIGISPFAFIVDNAIYSSMIYNVLYIVSKPFEILINLILN